ncbi:RICIN domain-containing protein [Kitasatospora sp. NPDC058406]|uniref:RICIN domain-containing protein n=1 Tax=Kitasatospora sp. NPDC058406 TaxID=3346483 RepID=UPI003650A8F6
MATTDAHAVDLKGAPCAAGDSSNCFGMTSRLGAELVLNPYAYFTDQLMLDGRGQGAKWRLRVNQSDGTFGLVNNTFGKCLEVRGSSAEAWNFVYAADCQEKPAQKWYFHPSGSDFLLRNVSSGRCLDTWGGNKVPATPVGATSCKGSVSQQWFFGNWTTEPTPKQYASAYAVKKCEASPATCSWDMKSEAPAAPMPSECVSEAWYNSTSAPTSHTFTMENTTGWSNELGSQVEAEFESGTVASLIAKVTVRLTVSYKSIWSGSKTVNNQGTYTVPPGQYGWITLNKVARKVTGTWTFSANDLPWKANDTVAVPIAHDPNGLSTIYTINTGEKPPVCSS